MAKVTEVHPSPLTFTIKYREGDITRALAEGLKHERTAADIETAFAELLFLPISENDRDEIVLFARELLLGLLETQHPIQANTNPPKF